MLHRLVSQMRLPGLSRPRRFLHRGGVLEWVLLPGLLFLLAFGARLALLHKMPLSELNPDYAEYERLATVLLREGQFGFGHDFASDPRLATDARRLLYQPEAATSRPPGYPAILALLMWGFGPDQRVFAVAAAAVEAVIGLVLFWLAAGRWGLVAGCTAWLLWLTMPRSHAYTLFLIREPYVALVFLLAFACVLRTARTGRLIEACLAGALLGAGAYLKETVVMAAVPVAAWLAFQRDGHGRRQWRQAALVLTCAGAATAPWMIRNSLVTGAPAGLSNFGWYNVHRALLDQRLLPGNFDATASRADLSAVTSPQEADAALKQATLAFAREHPLRTAMAFVRNAAIFWSPVAWDLYIGQPMTKLDAVSAVHTLFCFAFAIWAAILWRREPEVRLIGIILLFMTLLHGFFPAYPRFRYICDPLVILLAAGGLQLAVAAMAARRSARDDGTDLNACPCDPPPG